MSVVDHVEDGCSRQQDTSVRLDWNRGARPWYLDNRIVIFLEASCK